MNITFLKEAIILLAFTLSAFWVVITGVTLLPGLATETHQNFTSLFYSLGTLCLSIIIIYKGMVYLKIFHGGEDD